LFVSADPGTVTKAFTDHAEHVDNRTKLAKASEAL